ncbi:hypothetical protein FH972_005316 [Carpinus fangiana]|uniref:Uncharacterized protein n=1 Tax=Carpinus fangiana TaxID=176857 RepID=A0A5N6QRS9_9ROSI|nr:hypothetical protein FH972_005316 [Carpinus fangiana]
MADWSQLPKELLGVIAERLDGPFYQLRFRSVCSSWRSSVSPRPLLRLPGRFPFLQCDGITDSSWGFHLSRRSIFLLASTDTRSQTSNSSWLVKVEELYPNRMRLLNPLSRIQLRPLPTSFPNPMNLTHFIVFELGQEYVLHYMNYRPFGDAFGDLGNLYMEKVVFMSSGCGGIDEAFSLLTIHVSGKLAMFKSGDKRWTIIHEMPSPYDDVALFQGEFYAVDGTGRAVLVGLSLDVTLVAESVYGGDKKFLVESNGGLLLVDMYLSVGDVYVGDDEDIDVEDQYVVGERAVRFKVFRLDIEGKRWVEVESLRDRVLFLGDDCAFSASVAELSLSGCIKGNCVLFTDNFFSTWGEDGSGGGGSDGVFKGRDICVFDLDNGSIAHLADCPEYSKLFWPPPDWVAATNLTVQNQFEELAL